MYFLSITESDTAAETDSTTTLDDFKHSSNKHSKSKSDQTDRQVLIKLEEDLDDDDGDRPRRSQRPPPQRRRLQKLQSQLNLSALAQNELELKANLFYHIGNPIKRWRVEKVVPWKLVLQLLKTFCLLVQVKHIHAHMHYTNHRCTILLYIICLGVLRIICPCSSPLLHSVRYVSATPQYIHHA